MLGIGMSNKRILCISDTHFPYQHPDTIKFLKAVKKKYNPDRVIHIGDEVDHHAMSFHKSDPDLPSPGHELQLAIKGLKDLYRLFPKVDLLESNHGSMVYRKAKEHGIPLKYLKTYNEILDAPVGWKWHLNLTVKPNRGGDIFFHHGMGSANVLLASQRKAMNVVQGHYHSKSDIQYWGNSKNLYWGFQLGCSIDDDAMAFAYNKVTTKRPIIMHGIILDGQPKQLPMILNAKGRWTGFVP